MKKSAGKREKLLGLRAQSGQPPRLRTIDGFTLIEMLVVVVVLGVLATIGSNVIGARENAYRAMMKADLKNLATKQAPHFTDNYQYADDLSDLTFTPSEGITMELLGEAEGFTARTTHLRLPRARCAIFMGTVSSIYSPAMESGAIRCDEAGGGGGGGGP